jgi:predicted DNA-binding transcriptional regulator AlpA
MDFIRGEVTGRKVGGESALAFSIHDFCELHSISRAYFYKLVKLGLAPRVMNVGGRKLISVEAAAAWRREREATDQIGATV